ncbi:hypothetical protein FRIGORI9N_100041 [Frigoribacterium sp. 9N]|nr:hypothetical protein FRIGORI9N_100041 [Frigoribacterium sp. 9N]
MTGGPRAARHHPPATRVAIGGGLLDEVPTASPVLFRSLPGSDFQSRKEVPHGESGLVRQGLLRRPRCLQRRHARRAQEGLPQARAQVPPRLQPRRRGQRGEVQRDQ